MKTTVYLAMLLLLFLSFNTAAQGIIGSDTVITIAGTPSDAGYSGDGGPATLAQLYFPFGTAFDKYGNLFVADENNQVIRRVDTNGTITTIAGNGIGHGGRGGYSGDGGPATAAQLSQACDVAFDRYGNLFIADCLNNVIRKVDTNGTITTFAGNGYGHGGITCGYTGDNGPATGAELCVPTGIVFDSKGNLYIADQHNGVVRKVDTAGIITTFAGVSPGGTLSGDGGPATAALFYFPTSLACDKYDNIYVTDQTNNVARKIDTNGIITRVAGTGMTGYSGDGGPATAAELWNVVGIAVDTLENAYISDYFNDVIRKVDPAGVITTVAGYCGICGPFTGSYSGDGVPATSAEFFLPAGLTLDKNNNLYICDVYSHVVRKVINNPPAAIDTAALAVVPVIYGTQAGVYPNPFFSELTITNAAGMNLRLLNVLGEEVCTAKITVASQTIDLSALPPGVYLAAIGQKRLKVVKE